MKTDARIELAQIKIDKKENKKENEKPLLLLKRQSARHFGTCLGLNRNYDGKKRKLHSIMEDAIENPSEKALMINKMAFPPRSHPIYP